MAIFSVSRDFPIGISSPDVGHIHLECPEREINHAYWIRTRWPACSTANSRALRLVT